MTLESPQTQPASLAANSPILNDALGSGASIVHSIAQNEGNGQQNGNSTVQAPTAFRQITESRETESAEYVATTESHLDRSNYLGDSEVQFREEMASHHSLNTLARLSEVDYRILRLQNALDLPQRSVRSSLIDNFFKFCSPWTPIVESSWVDENRGSQPSLLLLNAIFLAGSRVSSTQLMTTSAEEFYCRARLLFILGHEADAMISIVASCLLNWWNPTGPEQISTSTSGFWVRIAVGLAYQIGLHRESKEEPERPLRRRLWWSVVVRKMEICA